MFLQFFDTPFYIGLWSGILFSSITKHIYALHFLKKLNKGHDEIKMKLFGWSSVSFFNAQVVSS